MNWRTEIVGNYPYLIIGEERILFPRGWAGKLEVVAARHNEKIKPGARQSKPLPN